MVSDHELIRRIVRRGDKEAADKLFDRYYREIYAWFVFRNLITAYNGNELFGVSLWLLTASILCLISVRRFIKRDCQ